MLFTINCLLESLEGFVIECHMPIPISRPFRGCYMLDGMGAMDGRTLYMGTPDTFVQAMDQGDGEGCTYVLAGTSPALGPYFKRQDMNIVVTAMTMQGLCNLLLRLSADADQWEHSMNRHMYIEGNLPKLIECGCRRLQGDAYLIDTGYKLMCANPEPRVLFPPFMELREKEYLCLSTVQEVSGLFRNDGEQDWIEHWIPVMLEGNRFFMRRFSLMYKTSVTGYLILVLEEKVFSLAAREIANEFFVWVERFLLKFNQEKYEANSSLSTLFSDLIEGNLEESEELVSRLKQLPISMKKYYQCIVVEFEERLSGECIAHVISLLERKIPQSTIVPYKGDILILAWKKKHYAGININQEELNQFLKEYKAVACIGNFTRWLNSLRPIYRQTKGVIEFAKVFRPTPETRLFRYEDYSMYQIVSLCVGHGEDFFGGDLVYLCHPGVITLAAYDQKHETNLCEVLNIHLMNDRNLTQTAKDLFFHRNTIQNKLDKIEEILGEDLNNAMIRQRLLFSCRVLEYLRHYLNIQDIYGKRRFFPATAERVEAEEKNLSIHI